MGVEACEKGMREMKITPEQIITRLEAIASSGDFEYSSRPLTEEWRFADAAVDFAEPILRFMERHPEIHFGIPGPVIHFLEARYHAGSLNEADSRLFRELIIESFERKPTPATINMLNRQLVGAHNAGDVSLRCRLVRIMEVAKDSPKTSEYARLLISDCLGYQARRERGA
jgi:hypothetical protein